VYVSLVQSTPPRDLAAHSCRCWVPAFVRGRLGCLLRWASWPPALQAAVHAIYPAIIVYQSAQRLRPTGGLEEASICADTYILGPPFLTCGRRVPFQPLLRAVRTGGAGQLEPAGHPYYTRTSPRRAVTYRIPRHNRGTPRGYPEGCCIGCILYRSYTSETRCLKAQRSFTAIHRLTLYNLSYATSLLGTPGQHAGASLPRPACGGLPCRHMARLQEKADERLITTHALCFN